MKKIVSALVLAIAAAGSMQVQAGNCSYQLDQVNYWAGISNSLTASGYSTDSGPVRYADSRGKYWAGEYFECLGKAQQ